VSVLRSVLAAALGAFVWLARWSSAKRGMALVYHLVAEARGDPDRQLVPAMDTATFEWQLRFLRRHFRLVTASELRDAALGRRRGERFPVALTLDDDLPSHRAVVMPLLARMDLPATFFLNGASLEGPFSFWWERLQLAANRGVAPSSFLEVAGVAPDRPLPRSIHEVSNAIQTMAPADRQAVLSKLPEGAAEDGAGLREEDVRALAGAGFEVEFHTLHHHALPTLGDAGLDEAMTEGRQRLASVVGRELDVIAYPHGRADARVAAAARRAGFKAGFTVERSAVRQATDPHLMGRWEPAPSRLSFAFALVGTLLGT
jgi:peptidoglycan/xylan/chitin deacetylase (PgdA/CDA1 family)